MKVFISWSGELSRKVAKSIKKFIMLVIPTVDVFFSPEDIKKGEKWDYRLTNELAETDYGIICLTKENITSPWINFESGALAKAMKSRVTALLVDAKPSDIKGPLTSFQATKFIKDEVKDLLKQINESCDRTINSDVFNENFNIHWEKIHTDIINEINVNTNIISDEDDNKKVVNSDAIEEILRLSRKHETILSALDDSGRNMSRQTLEMKAKENGSVKALSDELKELLELNTKLLSSIDDINNNIKNNTNVVEVIREVKYENQIKSQEFDYTEYRFTIKSPNKKALKPALDLNDILEKSFYSSKVIIDQNDDLLVIIKSSHNLDYVAEKLINACNGLNMGKRNIVCGYYVHKEIEMTKVYMDK